MTQPRLVAHLLYRFEFGGVQSLLADCIARMDDGATRHVVFCLAGHDAAAAEKLGAVELIDLDRPGRSAWHTHRALHGHLRRLRPALLHTYNIAALEYALTGALAGVPRRIHAEHGRGMLERDGRHRKYNFLRYAMAPLIDTFVTVSDDMVAWLTGTVGIAPGKVRLIRNGIDLERFAPAIAPHRAPGAPFTIGTIGRLDPIKAQADLITAFSLLHDGGRAGQAPLRLIIAGEGPLAAALAQQVHDAGLDGVVCMRGPSRDIAALLHTFDVFVLPSVSEATPMTVLEAMAAGVPVVATRVGGVPALVGADERGTLVAPSDPAALARALQRHLGDPGTARHKAQAARRFVATHYNLDTTAAHYAALYDTAKEPC
jgi:sugar transferase (PEP-CTERM/EpsH1 system associated)